MAEIVQIGGAILQLGLIGFLVNWAKSAIIDKVSDHEKRIQKFENFEEFKQKHLKNENIN